MNQNQAFDGVGQRLGYPHDEDAHHNVPAAQLAGKLVIHICVKLLYTMYIYIKGNCQEKLHLLYILSLSFCLPVSFSSPQN